MQHLITTWSPFVTSLWLPQKFSGLAGGKSPRTSPPTPLRSHQAGHLYTPLHPPQVVLPHLPFTLVHPHTPFDPVTWLWGATPSLHTLPHPAAATYCLPVCKPSGTCQHPPTKSVVAWSCLTCQPWDFINEGNQFSRELPLLSDGDFGSNCHYKYKCNLYTTCSTFLQGNKNHLYLGLLLVKNA